MFKKDDVVKIKGVKGRHLIAGGECPVGWIFVVNSEGLLFHVHHSRVSHVKVKVVRNVYQLTKENQLTHGFTVCVDKNDAMPCIGNLAHVAKRATEMRNLYPHVSYVIWELTIKPHGTTAVRTTY